MSNFTYTNEQLITAVKNSVSIAETCRLLGIKDAGANYQTVKKLINELNLDISHFTGRAWNQGKKYRIIKPARKLEDILTTNSNYQSYKLSKRLINAGIKQHQCENCKLTHWLDQLIKLELHHINGDRTDNRIENIQLLCPNCHAYTDNYRGKNISIIKRADTNKINSPKYKEITSDDIELLRKNKEKQHKAKIKICPICGKEFKPNGNVKYCSVECYRADSSVNGNRPDALQLINDLKEYKVFTQIGVKYNVSDNAVRKWCKLYKLPSNCKELEEFLLAENIKPNIHRNTEKTSYNKGEKNSQFGTKWISKLENNEIITKQIKKSEMDEYISQGWHLGRK